MTKSLPCPNCGAAAAGRFCAECGAVVGSVTCPSCGAVLTPGARFCHECGAPAGVGRPAPTPAGRDTRPSPARTPTAPSGPRSNLPLFLAGTAFVILAVIFAAQRAGQEGPVAASGAPPVGGAGNLDITSMSPRERASRLFDRIMRLHGEGQRDSVQFFASMALGVYESLGPLDHDFRYDYGRIAEVSGNLEIAAAQADTILQQSPDHLLGLILSANVAVARGQAERVVALNRRLLSVEAAQLAGGLQEYNLHRADIDAALAAARRR